ncbi:MAG: CDP-alcohol phosphatidyltransferase family protein [bacterium]|nr:CDP-alcohol phosphatidyltransferase family protein [bacterium]
METTNETSADSTNSTDFQYKKSLKKKKKLLLNKLVQVEKYFHRPLAGLMVRAIYKTPVTPNQVSYFSFLLGLAAIFFFTQGTAQYFALGGIFTLLSSIVDCADGQLARLKDMCSDYGAYLDIFFDRIVDFGIIAGIAIGYYNAAGNVNLLIMGLLAAGLYLLQISLFYLKKQFLKNKSTGETSEAHSLLLLVICIFGVINRLDILIYILLAETIIVVLVRLINFISLGGGQRKQQGGESN